MLSRKQIRMSHFRLSRTTMYSLMSTLSCRLSPLFWFPLLWLLIDNSAPRLKIDQFLGHNDPVPAFHLDVFFEFAPLHDAIDVDIGDVFLARFVVADQLHLPAIREGGEVSRSNDRLRHGKLFVLRQQQRP